MCGVNLIVQWWTQTLVRAALLAGLNDSSVPRFKIFLLETGETALKLTFRTDTLIWIM